MLFKLIQIPQTLTFVITIADHRCRKSFFLRMEILENVELAVFGPPALEILVVANMNLRVKSISDGHVENIIK
jgi:hypothetical protein